MAVMMCYQLHLKVCCVYAYVFGGCRLDVRSPESREDINAQLTVAVIIDGFDLAKEGMIFAWQALISKTPFWCRCGGFGTYTGKWGQFVPRDDGRNMTGLEKYNQDKPVAC